MTKQYVFIEKTDDGETIRYTFETKAQLKDFLNAVIAQGDFDNFEVKTEWVSVSI